MKRRKGNCKGGRHKTECSNCGERDVTKMLTGQRTGYAECHCGWCFDVETGQGRMRPVHKEDHN